MLKNGRFIGFLSLFLLSTAISPAQGRGAIFDEKYDNLPRRAELSPLSYAGLPSSCSLKFFAPLPGDQADYGTCVAWAAGYAARTISESVTLNRLNQSETTRNAFSPVYIYRNAQPDDPECMTGMQIYKALDFMRDFGAAKILDVEKNVSFPRVNLAYYRTVKKYPITGYVTLFSRDERRKPALITRIVKKSIFEGKPVIIGINTPDSFNKAEEVWRPTEDPSQFYYGHALCVVGFDDNKFGGAFEVLNSWGRKWGNGGYIWIPYQTFVNFVTEGYEITENIVNFSGTNKFDGFVRIEISGENAKTAVLKLDRNNIYTTTETFKTGTETNFIIGAGESAYVYSFTVSQTFDDDNFFSPVLLFPQSNLSPLLNYRDSAVTLPGEGRTIRFDTNGATYLITLYAKYPLDITAVIRTFTNASGSINKRLAASIGDGYTTSLSYSESEAAFTLTPDNPRAAVALVVAIRHGE